MTAGLARLARAQAIVITGTDTDVGKTVTTAAIAASFGGSRFAGSQTREARTGGVIAVVKPTQTGVCGDDPGDLDEVARLAGHDRLTCVEGVRLAAPMAPVPAADREDRRLPTLDEHIARIRDLAARHDRVLVEGAGGLLVPLTRDGDTIADVARQLGTSRVPVSVAVVVVCRAGLGTLNHTMLTLEALSTRGLTAAGLVIGSWPAEPGEVETSNHDHLSRMPVPLLGRIPAGAPRLQPRVFRARAPHWLDGAQRVG